VEPDQTRLARIHTRVSGWVNKVQANFVGQAVKKGDPLLEIYSPELLTTQREYLIALKTGDDSLAAAALRRLRLLGVSEEEVHELERTREARDTLTLRSPIEGQILDRNVVEGSYVEPAAELYRVADLSVVWVQARVYEYELPHIEIDQHVHLSLLSQPGKRFHGKVSFIEPVLQEATRTAKVRVVVKNPDGVLRPGTYADLEIQHDMGSGLLVPESAVLRTGERALAFRVLEGGRFEPVEVTLGARFGDRVQVLKGLEEGEEVVTSAVFLIDAESRLKSAVGTPAGHQHGSPPAAPDKTGEHDAHQHDAAAPKPDAGGAHEHHH